MSRTVVASTVAVLVLVVVALVYVRVGWSRMETACSLRDRSVSYSWGWQPLGFTCTYGDGTTETSLWF